MLSVWYNKAMLHYYYRSKDKLFEKIFEEAFANFSPVLVQIFNSNLPIEDTIYAFVDKYIEFIRRNPYVPMFILRELQRNSDRITSKFPIHDFSETAFAIKLKEEIAEGKIREISLMELFVNVISLSVFPFVAKDIIKFIFNTNNDDYQRFIDERKRTVPMLIIEGIKIK
jgi:TetR/AcrR family transcriptional regulator